MQELQWILTKAKLLKDSEISISMQVSGADPGFGQGLGPASEAKSCRCSKVELHEQSEPLVARVQGPFKSSGSFWVFNAQICILLHSRDSFSVILTASSTPKMEHYIKLSS